MTPITADPEALVAAASEISRGWGLVGYRVTEVTTPGWSGGVLLTVHAGDGSEFWVGATKHGNVVHGEDRARTSRELLNAIAKEREA